MVLWDLTIVLESCRIMYIMEHFGDFEAFWSFERSDAENIKSESRIWSGVDRHPCCMTNRREFYDISRNCTLGQKFPVFESALAEFLPYIIFS